MIKTIYVRIREHRLESEFAPDPRWILRIGVPVWLPPRTT